MARPLRIAYPGALYHVTSRGNAQQRIVEDDEDRHAFVAGLEAVVCHFNWLCHNWLCHAYCLMDNHYHLVIETPDGNLPPGMRQLNGVYTQRFNRRHGRVGHVLQGRYKAILVERESYLLELCRYVVLNPVRAGLVQAPNDYPWSSYRATGGTDPAPAWLTTDWVLAQFGHQRRQTQARYQAFVLEGVGHLGPWEQVRGQILLGHDAFITRLQPALKHSRAIPEVPKAQRFADRPRLEDLFQDVEQHPKAVRNQLIQQAYEEHGVYPGSHRTGGGVTLHDGEQDCERQVRIPWGSHSWKQQETVYASIRSPRRFNRSMPTLPALGRHLLPA